MGIVSSVKQHCIGVPDEQRTPAFLNNNGKAINDDYAYFQQQNWYRLQNNILFDPNKFIFLYTNYKQIQQKLVNQWKIVDIKKLKNNEKIVFSDQPMQPKWLYAIRRGVPIKYHKNVIQMMFAKTFSTQISNRKYQSLLYEKTKKNFNKIQPVTFQEENQVQAFSTPFLNKDGMEAAKRVAYLLSKTHTQIEYNIYLLKLISLLLIFVPEPDTYDILTVMIEGSTSLSLERQQSLRWHLTLTNNQLQKFTRQFFKTVKDISPSIKSINDHLNTQGIDKFSIFRQILSQFFIGFLPFHIVLHILIIFLNEGVKVFYRFTYAILKMTGSSIKDSTSTKQIIRLIRTKLLTNLCNEKSIKDFFRYAYDLQLETMFIRKSQIQLKRKVSKKQFYSVYYLPEVIGDSEILSFQDVETIWGFLPKIIKHYDIRKIFSTSTGTNNLSQMLETLQNHQITLILIETFTETVFGVFLAEKLKVPENKAGKNLSQSGILSQNSESMKEIKLKHSLSSVCYLKDLQYFGSSQSFLFTIRPQINKFPASGQNIYYCSYLGDNLAIGGPTPALQLSSSLTQAISCSSPTYCNQPLHEGPPGEFKIKILQCFSIQ